LLFTFLLFNSSFNVWLIVVVLFKSTFEIFSTTVFLVSNVISLLLMIIKEDKMRDCSLKNITNEYILISIIDAHYMY